MSRTSSLLEEKDESLRKGFQNMSLSFNTHGDSSQGTYSRLDMMSKLKGSVSGVGPDGAVVSCVICETCSKLHPPYANCVDWTCHICYKVHHPRHCSYFDSIPQGAPYNKCKYEIFCVCGNVFNEDKWICTSCGQTEAKLGYKFCFTCLQYDHSAYECPKDKALAAKLKVIRDDRRSRVPVFKPCESSGSDYVPTAAGVALLEEWEKMGILVPHKVAM